MAPVRLSDALNRLRGTFLEIPGTKLTADQASKLCGIELPECGKLLDVLKNDGFLTLRPDGSFVKAS